jgi:hypothetical protein
LNSCPCLDFITILRQIRVGQAWVPRWHADKQTLSKSPMLPMGGRMKRPFFLLTVTSLVLAACSGTAVPDIKTPAVATATPRPATNVQPTVTESSSRELCVTERPLALWETKGPALEETVKCIEGLADRWWEEEELALLWEGSDPNWGEQKLFIAPDGEVGIGCCDGLFMPLQFMPYQEEIWSDIQARFASFHYELEGEKLIFGGTGEIASPAWQRAIRTWSRMMWGQLYTGHVCAACSTVLTWRHKEWKASEKTDYCATLLVTDMGRVAVSPLTLCDGGESDLSTTKILHTWLTTDEWEQFDAWLYSRDPTYFQDGQFSGQGSQQMIDDERLELSTWVESVYTRLTSNRSN